MSDNSSSSKKSRLQSKVEKKPVSKKRVRRSEYVLDLRVHSPASLGYYGLEGVDTAPALISLAKVKGLDVIAVTDFYSGAFVDRVVEAAIDSPVNVIPGVDMRCVVGGCEDIILTCLFPDETRGSDIEKFLEQLRVPKEAQGNSKYILRCDFEEILSQLDKFGGVAFPSRIDMTQHRLATIRTLVDEFGFRAFDLAYPDSVEHFKDKWPRKKFNLFTFSSANSLAQVGSRTAKVKLPSQSFDGIRDLVARS